MMMKAIYLSLALALSSPLASCNGVQVTGSPALIVAEKTLTVSHKAYDAAGTLLKAAAETGLLKGANAAAAKGFYDKAGDALIVADTADKAANAQGILDQVSIAEDAIAQAQTLIGKK